MAKLYSIVGDFAKDILLFSSLLLRHLKKAIRRG
jgi:hypothetical protein